MELNHSLLKEAAEHGLISEQQAEQLWSFLGERGKDTPSFRFTHVLYYLGGLTAIGAMSLFMTLGWERFGGWGLFLIALAYAGVGIWLTEYFLNHSHLSIPAGITAAFVVVLTPWQSMACKPRWAGGLRERFSANTTHTSTGVGCLWNSRHLRAVRSCCGATGCRSWSCPSR